MIKRIGAQFGIVVVLMLAVMVGVLVADSTIDANDGTQAIEEPASPAGAVWSSGWVAVNPGSFQTLTHDLGGDIDDYAVDLWFGDSGEGGLGLHSYGYGGFEQNADWYGGYWRNLTPSTINLAREQDDETADLMMVRIRVVDAPDYDSGWRDIAEGEVMTLTHNLGGNPEDYTCSLWFEDEQGAMGVHSYRFGGAEEGGSFYGAHWQNLTDASVRVFRAPDEALVDRVRLRIVKAPPAPDYDSGWQPIDPGGTLTMTHNLGGNPAQYRGTFQYRDTSLLPSNMGQHARYVGGAAIGNSLYGGHWQRLTNSAVEVVRQPGGVRSAEVRVRLWAPAATVYLPFVVKSPEGQ